MEDVTYSEFHKTFGSAQTSVAWQHLWHRVGHSHLLIK